MQNKDYKILVINLGSTSSKVAVYGNEAPLYSTTLRHSAEKIKAFGDIWGQYEYRKTAMLEAIRGQGYEISQLDAVVSRGGLFRPIPGGTYTISKPMLADARSGAYGSHVCSVGCQMAFDLGQEAGIPAFTVDPPTCDELCGTARYSGIPQISRQSRYHALNQKAIARKLAKDLNKAYNEIKAIVVHLGGGISVGAHCLGNVIDVNNALDGDGPFSPERAGGLPVADLIKLCFSARYSEDEMIKMVNGRGGLVAYLGSTDGIEIEQRIAKGDEKAQEVIDAMAFQIAKEIGAAATVLKGEVEAIVLTGGLAHWKRLVELISERTRFIAPIRLYPGEDEMGSLAMGTLRVLRSEEPVQAY